MIVAAVLAGLVIVSIWPSQDASLFSERLLSQQGEFDVTFDGDSFMLLPVATGESKSLHTRKNMTMSRHFHSGERHQVRPFEFQQVEP